MEKGNLKQEGAKTFYHFEEILIELPIDGYIRINTIQKNNPVNGHYKIQVDDPENRWEKIICSTYEIEKEKLEVKNGNF